MKISTCNHPDFEETHIVCATPWTIAHRAPLFMDFLARNTAVGCHFLLQGTLLTHSSKLPLLCLLHWQADSSPLTHREAHISEGVTGFVIPSCSGDRAGCCRTISKHCHSGLRRRISLLTKALNNDSSWWTVSDSWSSKKMQLWDQGSALITQELLCSSVLLKYNKRHRESFWHRHQKGYGEYPPR